MSTVAASERGEGVGVRLAGQEWRTLVSSVRLGGDDHRVIRPARSITHGFLAEGRFGAHMSVGRAAAEELAFAWWLAARSPRSLVYLPLRSGEPRCPQEYDHRLDLVLLHHSLQFPVSRWKQVRARLSPSAPHTMTLPSEVFPTFDRGDHDRRSHREFRDHLRWRIAADTLFVIGSRHAFELQGHEVRGLVEECPSHLTEQPDAHCCAEIDLGRRGRWARHQDHRNPYAQLHVQYCNDHWQSRVWTHD